MLCKKCMVMMTPGTEYHPQKDKDDKGYKRFYRCGKCANKIFTKEHNFQECISNVLNSVNK